VIVVVDEDGDGDGADDDDDDDNVSAAHTFVPVKGKFKDPMVRAPKPIPMTSRLGIMDFFDVALLHFGFLDVKIEGWEAEGWEDDDGVDREKHGMVSRRIVMVTPIAINLDIRFILEEI